MAQLVDFGGSVNSNLVNGLGTNEVTFTMPGNVGLQVESVLATIDNTAGAATGAMLTIRDQSGEVIARQRQGTTIDAGVNGTATWALRLGGDAASTQPIWARYQGTQSIPVTPASGSLDWILVDGTALLDLTNPLIPTVLRGGTYFASHTVETVGATAGAFYHVSFQMDPYQAGNASTAINTTLPGTNNAVNIAGHMAMVAGGFINDIIHHDQAAAQDFHHITDIVLFP